MVKYEIDPFEFCRMPSANIRELDPVSYTHLDVYKRQIFIQPWSVFLSFAVCTVTGVFFGWYPAKKAAEDVYKRQE